MIKKLLLSMVVSLIAITSLAQTIVIKGTVKDFDGGTLPGARISEEGTTNYTLADVDGNYKIEVQPNAILGYAMSNYNPLFVSVNQGTCYTTKRKKIQKIHYHQRDSERLQRQRSSWRKSFRKRYF